MLVAADQSALTSFVSSNRIAMKNKKPAKPPPPPVTEIQVDEAIKSIENFCRKLGLLVFTAGQFEKAKKAW